MRRQYSMTLKHVFCPSGRMWIVWISGFGATGKEVVLISLVEVIIQGLNISSARLLSTCNSYTMGCSPARGDNPRALASGLSYVQVDKHGIITISYHLHQCRPCTSRDISC